VDSSDSVRTADSFEQLRSGIRKRQHPLRASGTLPMYLFDEHTFIAVNLHNLVQKAPRPSAVRVSPLLSRALSICGQVSASPHEPQVQLEARTNKPVKVETTSLCEATGEVLQPSNIGHNYTKYGGESTSIQLAWHKLQLLISSTCFCASCYALSVVLVQASRQWYLPKRSSHLSRILESPQSA
jgi:hypothetical protein